MFGKGSLLNYLAFKVADYDAIRKLPDIANYIKNRCITDFFSASPGRDIINREVRDFAVWWIRHPNFKIHKYEDFDGLLQKLVYENASEDVLIRSNINYSNSYELILVAIKRSFHRLLKRCLWVQYNIYQKPACYYVNSQIYKLLTNDHYFDPKILTVYVNALNNIKIRFDWNTLTLTQIVSLNGYKESRNLLTNDSDEEISDLSSEDNGDSDD
jgi:hypothetical protein